MSDNILNNIIEKKIRRVDFLKKSTSLEYLNEIIDKNLLRYMTVRVKKFDLEAKYFSKKDENEKKEYKKDYNKN